MYTTCAWNFCAARLRLIFATICGISLSHPCSGYDWIACTEPLTTRPVPIGTFATWIKWRLKSILSHLSFGLLPTPSPWFLGLSRHWKHYTNEQVPLVWQVAFSEASFVFEERTCPQSWPNQAPTEQWKEPCGWISMRTQSTDQPSPPNKSQPGLRNMLLNQPSLTILNSTVQVPLWSKTSWTIETLCVLSCLLPLNMIQGFLALWSYHFFLGETLLHWRCLIFEFYSNYLYQKTLLCLIFLIITFPIAYLNVNFCFSRCTWLIAGSNTDLCHVNCNWINLDQHRSIFFPLTFLLNCMV